MSMTREELLHLAKLSRLRIEEDQFETLQQQLDKVLGYVGRLQTVEVPKSELQGMQDEAVVRPDAPELSSPGLHQDLLAAFPDRIDDLLRVPGVFEKPKD